MPSGLAAACSTISSPVSRPPNASVGSDRSSTTSTVRPNGAPASGHPSMPAPTSLISATSPSAATRTTPSSVSARTVDKMPCGSPAARVALTGLVGSDRTRRVFHGCRIPSWRRAPHLHSRGFPRHRRPADITVVAARRRLERSSCGHITSPPDQLGPTSGFIPDSQPRDAARHAAPSADVATLRRRSRRRR